MVCLDIDPVKVALLRSGGISIDEPRLQELNHHNVARGQLRSTSNICEAVLHGSVQFTVDPPLCADGSADVGHVEDAARNIGRYLTGYTLIAGKSTVPVGTAGRIRGWVQEELMRAAWRCVFRLPRIPNSSRKAMR